MLLSTVDGGISEIACKETIFLCTTLCLIKWRNHQICSLKGAAGSVFYIITLLFTSVSTWYKLG